MGEFLLVVAVFTILTAWYFYGDVLEKAIRKLVIKAHLGFIINSWGKALRKKNPEQYEIYIRKLMKKL